MTKKESHVFDELVRKVGAFVHGWKTDFEIDRTMLAEHPGVPFIHVARKNGTHLYMMPEDALDAKRLRQTNEFVHCTVFSEPGRVFTHYDGKKLRRVSKDEALRIWESYYERVGGRTFCKPLAAHGVHHDSIW